MAVNLETGRSWLGTREFCAIGKLDSSVGAKTELFKQKC